MSDDVRWLTRAVELATAGVRNGGGPFGAVLVAGGEEVATGCNRVTADLDPTAHAEVVALRAGARRLGRFELSGTVLYASCEPCPMCLSAALWGRVDRVVFAADRHDAAAAGFDDLHLYDVLAGAAVSAVPVQHVAHPRAARPFEVWAAHGPRIPY
jgi:guanine deaminase